MVERDTISTDPDSYMPSNAVVKAKVSEDPECFSSIRSSYHYQKTSQIPCAKRNFNHSLSCSLLSNFGGLGALAIDWVVLGMNLGSSLLPALGVTCPLA